MIKFVNVIKLKTGRKKIEFFQMGIYDLLRNHLGFRYTKINKKGYFLRENEKGLFEIVNFLELSKSFKIYINREFDNITELKGFSYNYFMNTYYLKCPIKNGNKCREYLSKDFELSDENLHQILMKIDFNYQMKYKSQEILNFLKLENFKETIDYIGNFAQNKPLFYKRLSSNQFLAFNQPFTSEKTNETTFDFWLINVQSEEIFLKKHLKDTDFEEIRLGFDLTRDIELYNEKIKCINKS